MLLRASSYVFPDGNERISLTLLFYNKHGICRYTVAIRCVCTEKPMMNTLMRLALLTSLLFAGTASCAEDAIRKGHTLWQHGQPSRIQIDAKGVATLVNHQYLINSPHRCVTEKPEHIVVSQQSTWKIGPWEGNNPNLLATAYRVSHDGSATRLWHIKESADEGRLTCDYYETTWYGCCSAQPNHRLYNPKTGKLLMEYGERLITVEVPNSPLKRFIGYKPSETIRNNDWEQHKLHIGTLTYASPDDILHRIAIRGTGKVVSDKFEMGIAKILIRRSLPKQEMAGDTLSLWDVDGSRDPKQLGGFSVILKYAGSTIELPVREDDLALPSDRHADYELIRIGK